MQCIDVEVSGSVGVGASMVAQPPRKPASHSRMRIKISFFIGKIPQVSVDNFIRVSANCNSWFNSHMEHVHSSASC